jgi:hypothetical protein
VAAALSATFKPVLTAATEQLPAPLEGRGSRRIHPAKVRISFGKPFTPRSVIPDGVDGEATYKAVMDEMKRRIQRMPDKMRSG